jgi:hypothetical protein
MEGCASKRGLSGNLSLCFCKLSRRKAGGEQQRRGNGKEFRRVEPFERAAHCLLIEDVHAIVTKASSANNGVLALESTASVGGKPFASVQDFHTVTCHARVDFLTHKAMRRAVVVAIDLDMRINVDAAFLEGLNLVAPRRQWAQCRLVESLEPLASTTIELLERPRARRSPVGEIDHRSISGEARLLFCARSSGEPASSVSRKRSHLNRRRIEHPQYRQPKSRQAPIGIKRAAISSQSPWWLGPLTWKYSLNHRPQPTKAGLSSSCRRKEALSNA